MAHVGPQRHGGGGDVDATAVQPYTLSLCCHAFIHACAKTVTRFGLCQMGM